MGHVCHSAMLQSCLIYECSGKVKGIPMTLKCLDHLLHTRLLIVNSLPVRSAVRASFASEFPGS